MRFELKWGEGIVRAVEQLTPTVRQIDIAPSVGCSSYAVGSHINVGVVIDEAADMRSYSLIGEHPVGGCYRIAVRQLADSRGGSRYMWGLAPGDRITLSDPQNLFEMSMDRKHYLLVAAGIGITPLLGMAKRLHTMGASFEMVYSARSRRDMPYREELEQMLGERLNLAISEEGTRCNLSERFAAAPEGTQTYFCGPIGMLEAARRSWRDVGGRAANFRFETFGSSGRFPREAFEVYVRDNDRRFTVPENMTMLDLLEQNGVQIMSDCKRGECGICLVTVMSAEGEIDHRDVFLSEEQKREGKQMCACVSRVAGGRVGGGRVTIDTGFRIA